MTTRINVNTELAAYDEHVADLTANVELHEDLNVDEYLSIIFQVMIKFVGYQPESILKTLREVVEFCDDPTKSEEENLKNFRMFYL